MNKNTYIVLLIIIILGIVFWVYYLPKKETITGTATVSTLSIADDTSTASAVLAGAKTVIWQTSNYPTNTGVNINLIRKTSDSPRQFEIVRTIAVDTANDGQETWTPQAGENLDDLYIEVTCSNTYQFKAGCQLSGDALKVN
ncbi:hypothetical protein A3B85_01100 [Candidatus Nomurabacteria bacterium RIFCSPHIGHO2_02_FULL_37_13]|uniref:Uncharacterized protein n=1 Tax=Candidatus Nomurabacteria bacterium RIFCSPHIGHO2_02_FULL_37_13 TaxID=1801750 RepID=A0A1F6W3X7_9BACT|nr:MAG: hypothetical protein A2640_00170 [Candidatus Nomurabacteria bacterium RIFCSPHIGHO2_01_FULL_36_23]OGI76648.1 MAG: hypothetical protein A3B85_01100 [Candidatus Nomurabacteria bacterium RIFCSPHIGHO2_02_FULL_37_13]